MPARTAHCELNLTESTRSVLISVVMVAVTTSRSIGCLKSILPLPSQNVQSHEKVPASRRAQGETPTMNLTLGANREGNERVKSKATCMCTPKCTALLTKPPRVHFIFAYYSCYGGSCIHE